MFWKKRHESTAKGAWSATLAMALYRPLSVSPGNLAFSPWSISVALAMLQAGADGETRGEIEAALGHPGAGGALVDVFARSVGHTRGPLVNNPRRPLRGAAQSGR